ncbi:MAG: metallophosphoesterase [Melioribacteraceae bacterium]|nr:metallophosphoesterase [Melioribacteraceae bacterium]
MIRIYCKSFIQRTELIPFFLLILFYTSILAEINPASNDTVYNKIIWQDKFEEKELIGWTVIDDIKDEPSDWKLDSGYLVQLTDVGSPKDFLGTHIISGNTNWENITIETNFIYTDDDFMGIIFRYQDENNYCRLLISFKEKIILLNKKVDGKNIEIARKENSPLSSAKFNSIISLHEDSIKIWLNNEEVFLVSDGQFKSGKVGFTSLGNLASFFDDITVYENYQYKEKEITQAIVRGPYLQNVLSDSAVIRWDTNFDCESIVEFGINEENPRQIKSETTYKKHEVVIKKLEPATKYFYRIKSGNITSDWHSLKSAPVKNSPFNFILYGDNQMNPLRHKEIINNYVKRDFDFIVSNGDVVQRGMREDWDTEFFGPLKNVLSEKPFYSAIGNHELNSPYFYQNFSYPNSEHENYYSFKYSNCFFIFIDNPRNAYPKKGEYEDFKEGSKQYVWIKEQLASDKAQKAEWLFVVSHVPSHPFAFGNVFPDGEKTLLPLFDEYNVDINFSGHSHGYERSKIENTYYIISAGGGGALSKKKDPGPKMYGKFLRDYNYCHISIEGNKLFFKAYDINDKLIDEFSIVK